MKLTVNILLLPAALAWPSYNGHGHGHSHLRHGYEAYKSGHHHASGAALPSGTAAGPYGLNNSTASPLGTAIGAANSVTSTDYLTLYSTVYQTADGAASTAPLSEAATVNTAGACGATITVTSSNTVTVTVTGGVAEAATSATPEAQTSPAPSSTVPELAVPAIETSSIPEAVTPTSQVAVPTMVPSVEASSIVPVETEAATNVATASATSVPATESATPQTQSPSPPGSKRGLFIPVSADATQADYVKAFNDNPGKISWIVNQFSGPPGGLSSSFNFVPQCYDKLSDESGDWTTNAKKAVAAGEKYFLSFGEPNTPNSQGFTMDAQEGAQEWMTMLQPYATDHGITIGSPGTLGSPSDTQWQNDFLDECAKLGCKIGFVAAHWFSPCGSATPQELADTFWGTINTYKGIAQNHSSAYGTDLKVWVDNFSLNCDSDTISKFLDIVVPQMDSDDMIERYGYVSMTEVSQANGFINTDGSISDLGLHYANM
ncbi:hypothetical protein P7C71_g6024, partial [Lecanoromycetidae sp. Uapishka_2]